MRPARLAAIVVVALLAAACSAASGAPAWTFVPGASPAPAASPSSLPASGAAATSPVASSSATAIRIEVTLSDALKIEPAVMTVPAGASVTFVVRNTGTVLHEFTLGDEAEQTAHEQEMMASGGMSMPKDEPMAIGVQPGTTKELTVTFDKPGGMLAGCHVAGHYAAGMKATITVE